MTSLKLAADSMLGGLAKWLRLLGFDTLYMRHGPFPPHTDCTLVTRRTARPHQPRLTGWPRVIRIEANDTLAQLAETLSQLGFTRQDLSPLTRCSLCNESLREASWKEIQQKAPVYVQSTQNVFALCPVCGRLYWPGTHIERMMKIVDEILPE